MSNLANDNQKKEKFVGFPNKMNAFDHKGLFIVKKDVNAFLVYYELGRLAQNMWEYGTCEVTVSMLNKLVKAKPREKENKKEIKRLLQVLQDLNWITIEYTEDEFDYDTLLKVTTTYDLENDKRIHDQVKSGSFNFKGWTGATQEMYEACKGNAEHFRMLLHIKWRSNLDIKYIIHQEEWMKVLDASKNTVTTLTNKLDELGLAEKIKGKLRTDNGQIKHTGNEMILTYDQDEVEQAPEMTDEHKRNIATKNFTNTHFSSDDRVKDTNIFSNTGEDFTPYCIHVGLTTECEVTKEKFNKRMSGIQRSSQWRYDDLMKQGREYEANKIEEAQEVEEVEELVAPEAPTLKVEEDEEEITLVPVSPDAPDDFYVPSIEFIEEGECYLEWETYERYGAIRNGNWNQGKLPTVAEYRLKEVA